MRRVSDRSFRRAALGIALLAASACDSSLSFSPLLERQRLAQARERWRDAAPANYSFTMQRYCFCLFEGEVRVRVEDGEVVSVRLVGSDTELVGPQRGLYGPIPDLFAVVADAIDRPAHSIDAEYDDALGFPALVFIDYDERIADEEYGFRVRDVSFP
jgi:hypothetical protein